MKKLITPQSRLAAGLILFAGTVLFVLAKFTTNASFLDIGMIGVCSLLMIPCCLALSCHQEWFVPKRKLLIALFLFIAAILAGIIVNKGKDFFSDTFMVLCFMAVTALFNVLFSKWSHTNIALLPHLAFDLCYMAVLILSFNLISEVEYGDSSPKIGIALSIAAMLIEHFFLLGQEEKTGIAKRLLLSFLMTLAILAGLFLLIMVKAVAA